LKQSPQKEQKQGKERHEICSFPDLRRRPNYSSGWIYYYYYLLLSYLLL